MSYLVYAVIFSMSFSGDILLALNVQIFTVSESQSLASNISDIKYCT